MNEHSVWGHAAAGMTAQASDHGDMDLEFSGEIWHWRGPSPFYFVTVPPEQSLELKAVSTAITYGWGMIPARIRIGDTEWTTSLWPKDGLYVVPLKAMVRRAEDLDEGDTVTVWLVTDGPT
jgi:hypothetical protein